MTASSLKKFYLKSTEFMNTAVKQLDTDSRCELEKIKAGPKNCRP